MCVRVCTGARTCAHARACMHRCTQSHLTLCDPMDCRPPGCSVHGIFRAMVLEQVAIPFSKRSYQLKNQMCIFCASCIGKQIFYQCTTWEAPPGHQESGTKERRCDWIPVVTNTIPIIFPH